jgi:hypothetical protein
MNGVYAWLFDVNLKAQFIFGVIWHHAKLGNQSSKL